MAASATRSLGDQDPDHGSHSSSIDAAGVKQWLKKFGNSGRPLRGYSGPRDRAKVAILDTGINLEHIPEELRARIKDRETFLGNNETVSHERDDDAMDEESSQHGSHIARWILRLAPRADLYIAKVVRSNESEVNPVGAAKVRKITSFPGYFSYILVLMDSCPRPSCILLNNGTFTSSPCHGA